jgi:hypothetical protein
MFSYVLAGVVSEVVLLGLGMSARININGEAMVITNPRIISSVPLVVGFLIGQTIG